MKTPRQKLGDFGENLITREFSCPKCKRENTLKKLPPNFKCADIICDFCGYVAQVKTHNARRTDALPSKILGAAWGPQKERMDAGIFFPLFVVLVKDNETSVFYLPADLQTSDMFIPRKPLSENAKRAGWQGYYFDGTKMKSVAAKLI